MKKIKYQHAAERISFTLRCCLSFLRYPYSKTKKLKNISMEIDSFLGTILLFSSQCFRRCGEAVFKICFGARDIDEEQKSIILQQPKIHLCVQSSLGLNGKRWRLFYFSGSYKTFEHTRKVWLENLNRILSWSQQSEMIPRPGVRSQKQYPVVLEFLHGKWCAALEIRLRSIRICGNVAIQKI